MRSIKEHHKDNVSLPTDEKVRSEPPSARVPAPPMLNVSMGEYGLDAWSDLADHMAQGPIDEAEDFDPALADFFGSDQFCT